VDDPLLTLESDKATMDVPAPFAGTVRELRVAVGDRVSQGKPLLTMESTEGAETGTTASSAASEGAPAEAAAPDAVGSAAEAEAGDTGSAQAPAGGTGSTDEPAGSTAGATGSADAPADRTGSADAPASADGGGPTAVQRRGPIYASPAVRRLARELGVDLAQVNGTGRKGRIIKQDVEEFAAGGGGKGAAAGAAAGAVSGAPSDGAGLGLALPPWPSVQFEKFGPVERVERSRIQRISGPNVARNWVMIPHVTHNDEADITELEAWRKQLNSEQDVKVTMVSFLVVACVATLKEFPIFNSSLEGDQLVLKRYYNIGFAADTPGGLVVPVIKDADQRGLLGIAAELSALSAKARDGKLAPGDMQGSTFTISSLGGIGGTSFTPIVNAPEVAILGVTRSAMKPVWNAAAESFAPRLMLPLSLSYDHRVIDGAAAARFVVHLVRVLSDLRRALL
jgi:pyruvate dehydrogenase E2 component (dihydrolipoamide acetyltransferase)